MKLELGIGCTVSALDLRYRYIFRGSIESGEDGSSWWARFSFFQEGPGISGISFRAGDPVTPQKDCVLGRTKALVISTLKAPSNTSSPRDKEPENEVTSVAKAEEYSVIKHHQQRQALVFPSKPEAKRVCLGPCSKILIFKVASEAPLLTFCETERLEFRLKVVHK